MTYQVKNKETERETFKPQLDQVTFDLEETPPLVYQEPVQEVIKEVKETSTLYQKQPIIEESQPIEKPIQQKPIKEKIYAKTQIHGTYLIGENEKGMYLVDQHAAQEKN